MTHQQKIDFIRRKCCEANPALMELGFGCRLILTGLQTGDEKHFVIGTTVAGDILTHKEGGRIEEPVIRSKNLIKENEYWTILGRLPSLADVLNAIGSKQIEMSVHVPCVFLQKAFMDFEDSAKNGFWNLLVPLDQQDEPTISFIFEILQ